MINTKTYCSLATSGWDSRTRKICCNVDLPRFNNFSEMHRDASVKKLVSDLESGIKNERCRECWKFESIGATSMRQTFLKYQKTKQSYELESANKKIRHLVLSTGIKCNFACRTCGPNASSGHVKEYEDRTGKTYEEGSVPDTDMTLLKQDLSDVITIEVLGGEPFLNLEHLEIIKHIGTLPTAKNCQLNYTTNGSVRLRSNIFDNFKNFKEVNICLSIDAVGKPFDYIRTLGKWNDVQKNIDKLIELKEKMKNIRIVAHPTIGSLNILLIDDLFSYFKDKEIDYYLGFCDYPKHYSLDIFNDRQKAFIVDTLSKSKHHKVDQIINKVNSANFKTEYLADFINAVKFTNKYRKLDYAEYLPELNRLIHHLS